MIISIEKKVTVFILILYIMSIFFSLSLNINTINLLGIGIIGLICTIILLYNEKLLILSALIASMLFGGLSRVNIVFQYIPLYIYLLMLIDILIKNKKNKINFILKWLFILSIFFSIVPIILNLDINVLNLMYSTLKRYCFIIIYIYMINSNLEYTEIYNLITKLLTSLLIINIPVFIIQFIKGVDRDFITGIFGNNMTGIVSQLLLILLCIKLKDLYFKKTTLMDLFTWLIISVVYFSLAEVKFGFLAVSILLLIFFIFINRGFKSIIVIAFTVFIIGVGYSVYMTTYSHQDFLSLEFIKQYLVEQSYSGDSINRIGFKNKIDTVVFNDDEIDKLLGKGIGSGNPSDYYMLKGSIYDKYDYLKYHWFFLPYIYFENGVIGLILFTSIYIYILIKSYTSYIKYKSEQGLLVFLISLVSFMYLIYNNSILTYSVMFIYWSYFGLLNAEEFSNNL